MPRSGCWTARRLDLPASSPQTLPMPAERSGQRTAIAASCCHRPVSNARVPEAADGGGPAGLRFRELSIPISSGRQRARPPQCTSQSYAALLCYIAGEEVRSMSSPPEPLVTVSPETSGGEPVFTGTRVPVQALFDYIEGGDPLDEFLDDFPDVSREHAIAVLEVARAGRLSSRQASAGRRVKRRGAGAAPARCVRTTQAHGRVGRAHSLDSAREGLEWAPGPQRGEARRGAGGSRVKALRSPSGRLPGP